MSDDKTSEESKKELAAGPALVTSYLERTYHAVMAKGNFNALKIAYLEHAMTLGTLPDKLALEMMGHAFEAATLQLALLPPDQFVSWTLNFSDPPLNLFLAGDNTGFQITGRAYTRDVKVFEKGRLFVESQRPKHKIARSVVDIDGNNVLGAFGEYYTRGIQMRARMFELAGGDLVLIQGLPNVDEEWLFGLNSEAVQELFDAGPEEIEQRTYRFHCGCSIDRIKLVVQDLFKQNPEELLDGDDEVIVQCPRCGEFWKIARSFFEGIDA